VVAAAVSLAVTATVVTPRQWPVYAAGYVLIGATYALVGVLLGPILGRVSGVFIAFLVPLLDHLARRPDRRGGRGGRALPPHRPAERQVGNSRKATRRS
jgi:hypothetical protein